jgi:hypothetical protein
VLGHEHRFGLRAKPSACTVMVNTDLHHRRCLLAMLLLGYDDEIFPYQLLSARMNCYMFAIAPSGIGHDFLVSALAFGRLCAPR